ncbi:gluconokinase [Microbacterium sp. Marseille-Q6965]|uniref:gluconokinase n=1 Tax=Microbacterium sp. Marseille-Q6965 TaxID=2965072 RepID=UPI0021B7F801|nr:gluconokinase [Microbacterium sp. Marseille-Q6965]
MTPPASSYPPVVVMGVQGAGKSTIANMLAERIRGRYVDGDRLHSAENVAKMASGVPLTDEDRVPWLHAIGATLASGRDRGIVVVCSALRRAYRDVLRADAPGTVFVHLHGSFELIWSRVNSRSHEYMPPVLLRSQFDSLEPLQPDEAGIVLDVAETPHALVDAAVAFLDRRRRGGAA